MNPRVTSDNLHHLDYWDGNLHVVFKSDLKTAYKYYDVPEQVYENILNSESIGRAFDVLIKKADPTYKFSRIRLVQTGNDPNTGLPVYSYPHEAAAMPFEEFSDVISYLEHKGLARKENDENGDLRVVFSGEWAKEMEGWFRRK